VCQTRRRGIAVVARSDAGGLCRSSRRSGSLATGAALAIGIAAAVVLFGLHLLYQQLRAASLIPRPTVKASLG
jgi:hypothetical protein